MSTSFYQCYLDQTEPPYFVIGEQVVVTMHTELFGSLGGEVKKLDQKAYIHLGLDEFAKLVSEALICLDEERREKVLEAIQTNIGIAMLKG